jgi:hypothetical protein
MFTSIYSVKFFVLQLVENYPNLVGPTIDTKVIDSIYKDLVDGLPLPSLDEGKSVSLPEVKALCYECLASISKIGATPTPQNCAKLVSWFLEDINDGNV